MDAYWSSVFSGGWSLAMGWMGDIRVVIAVLVAVGFIVGMLSLIGLGRR